MSTLKQIAEAVCCDHRRLAEFRELQLAQTLYPSGFDAAEKGSVEGSSAVFSLISLSDAPKYWMLAGIQTQNEVALQLVAACATETLERRVETAFGVLVPEPDRDSRITQRLAPVCSVRQRKKVRKALMHVYGNYDLMLGQPSGTTSRAMTVRMNEAIFGQTHFNCNRFTMTTEQQYAVAIFEANLLQSKLENCRYTIEYLVGQQVELFTAAYGDFYHLDRVPEHSNEYIDW